MDVHRQWEREPKVLSGHDLAGRFRYWPGTRGRRYLFTLVAPQHIRDFAGGLLIVTADAGPAGGERIVWTGPAEDYAGRVPAGTAGTAGLRHYVHLLVPCGDARARIAGDILRSNA